MAPQPDLTMATPSVIAPEFICNKDVGINSRYNKRFPHGPTKGQEEGGFRYRVQKSFLIVGICLVAGIFLCFELVPFGLSFQFQIQAVQLACLRGRFAAFNIRKILAPPETYLLPKLFLHPKFITSIRTVNLPNTSELLTRPASCGNMTILV